MSDVKSLSDNFVNGFEVNDAWRWLESNRRCVDSTLPPCSEFGRIVATIIDRALYGIHNQPRGQRKANWDGTLFIELIVSRNLATFDFRSLTNLVVLCHDACVRMEIQSSGPWGHKLIFHPRSGRDGRMSDRHPTLEDSALYVRSNGKEGS